MFRTTDYGQSWTRLVGPAQGVRGYAHVVREDAVERNLLFVGTELGLWISIDGGARWAQYKGGDFPSVPVRDLAVHPRDSDLVVATHGRGIWIVDDITPLRKLSLEALNADAALIESGPIAQRIGGLGGWPEGDAVFVGPAEPTDAVITYYQRRRHIFGELKLEVLDAQGRKLEEMPGSARRGMNRARWSMRVAPPRVPPAATLAFGATAGPRVVPGAYTLKLTKGKQTFTSSLTVAPDARAPYTAADRAFQFETAMRLHGMLGEMTFLVDRINQLRRDLAERAGRLPEKDSTRARLGKIATDADEIRKKIVATREGGAITGEERLRERMADLYGAVLSYEGRPADYQVAAVDVLARELKDVTGELDAFAAKALPELDRLTTQRKLPALALLTREAWEKREPAR